jgi:hypothetical protein
MKRVRTPERTKQGWKPILLARGLVTALAGVMFGAGHAAAHPRPPEASTPIDRVARIRDALLENDRHQSSSDPSMDMKLLAQRTNWTNWNNWNNWNNWKNWKNV